MKKLLLSLLVIGGLSLSAAAQFEFYVQGDPTNTNYAGSTYSIQALSASDQYTKVDVVNKTGSSDQFVIGRRRILPEASSWTDYMCWGGSAGGGLCIDAPIMDQEYFQMQNSAVPLDPDSMGLLESHIEPNFNDPGTYTYRYYVGTLNDYFIDSIDIEVTLSPLSVPEPKLTVGIQPNPATEYITIQIDGFESADVEIVDILGNIVMDSKITGQSTINVAEYRNGIYFVTVSASGTRVSRKVVVRH
ncbi:MAG: hypothetical protein Crog4KO_17350 [Crocinitomicaceae bacterium]